MLLACLSLEQAVLNEQAQVDKGDNARLSSFVGAIAIADLVKTTLGPKGTVGKLNMLPVVSSPLKRHDHVVVSTNIDVPVVFTGMDKILQSVGSRDGNISVTNDGATILRSIHVDNAAAKVLVDIAKTQDDEVCAPLHALQFLLAAALCCPCSCTLQCNQHHARFLTVAGAYCALLPHQVGDGTTSVTVLCGELLREAEQLVNARLHPQTIIQGWRLATAIARKV
jgi:T-complex protein 1 subunit beta